MRNNSWDTPDWDELEKLPPSPGGAGKWTPGHAKTYGKASYTDWEITYGVPKMMAQVREDEIALGVHSRRVSPASSGYFDEVTEEILLVCLSEGALTYSWKHDSVCIGGLPAGLAPHHFFYQENKEIFKKMQQIVASGKEITSKTCLEVFTKEDLTHFRNYKTRHLDILVFADAVDINGLAAEIIDLWRKREWESWKENLGKQTHSAAELQKLLEQKALELTPPEDMTDTTSYSSLLGKTKTIITETADLYRDKGSVGISTGLTVLDATLGGLNKSDLIVLAARPGMGKTALATNMAFNAAENGSGVLFFSVEMSAYQLCVRAIAGKLWIPSDRIMQGKITPHEQSTIDRYIAAMAEKNIPLFIESISNPSIADIKKLSVAYKEKHNIGLVVLDYLQLLRQDVTKKGYENRTQEVSMITASLKGIAKELDIPVLALSQLSRDVEKRSNKRPSMSDLRESGSIEQDADIVMFIYRDDYYDKQTKTGGQRNPDTQAEIIIAKNRHGSIANLAVHFNASLTKFSD